MPSRILVVDDSPLDRRLIEFFLKKGIPEVSLLSVGSGAEAIEIILSQSPDLVITDLQMPELNGLDVVERIAASGYSIPVILMTGTGNQELARKALKAGATSYVPKRLLDSVLVETVNTALSMSRWQQSPSRLVNSLVSVEMHFALSKDRSSFPPVIACLQEQIVAMGLSTRLPVTRIGMAIHEALLSTVAQYDAGIEVAPLVGSDVCLFSQTGERRQLGRDEKACMRLVAMLSDSEVRFSFDCKASGGVTWVKPEIESDQVTMDCIQWRGPLLIHSFMDDVVYNSADNETTIVKRIASDPTQIP
jgi:CheY-like chemotaxis protein